MHRPSRPYRSGPDRTLLIALFVMALLAGAVHPALALGFLAVAALVARQQVVAARRPRPMTDLQRRQREQLVAGRWS